MWIQRRTLQASNGYVGVFDSDYYQEIAFGSPQMPGLAFGGTNLRRAAGVVTLSSGTSLAVTGVGFRPHLLLFSTGFASIGNEPHFTEGAKVSYGACDRNLSQFGVAVYRGYNNGPSGSNAHVDDGVLCWGGYPGKVWVAALGDDGFTLEWDSAYWTSGEVGAIGWLAMRFEGGLGCKVGHITQPASTGVVTETTGFDAAAVMLLGVSLTSFSSSWVSQARANVGFAAVDGGESAMNGGHPYPDKFSTAVSYKADRSIYLYENDLSTLAVRGDANVVSTTGGFNVDWTVTDGVARKIGYVAWEADETEDGSDPLVHITAIAQSMLGSPGVFSNASLPYTDASAGLGWSISPTSSFMASAWWGGDSVTFHYARDRMFWGGSFFPGILYRLARAASERIRRRVLDVIRHNAPR